MQAASSNLRKGLGRGRGRGGAANQANKQPQPAQNRPQPLGETRGVPCTPPQPKYATPDTPPPTPPDGAMQHKTSLKPSSLASMARCSGDGSPESVALGLAGLSLEHCTVNSQFPRRPDYGKNGRTIPVVANHFEVSLPTGNIFHYDVDISVRKQCGMQSVLSKDCKRRVFILLVEQHAKHLTGNLPVFDGQKNMYTKNSLGFQKQSFTVIMEDNSKRDEFVVQVQFAAQLDLSLMRQLYNSRSKTPEVPKAVVQALEIILRYGPSTRLSVVGRSLYRPPRDNASLGGGLELWHGFQTSLKPGQWKPFVNVNTMVTAFFEPGPLVALMGKILGDRRGDLNMDQVTRLDNVQIMKLNKKLKKLKVQATHLPYPRKYVIEKVTAGSANDLTFGTPPQSVAAYFKSTYRELRYPNLPCIEVGSKRNYIPVEVCEVIAGQHCRRKLDENQTSAVVRKAAVPPHERFRNIQEDVRGCIAANKQYLDHFGIRMSDKPLQLTARVLPAHDVVYGDDKLARPTDGAWELQGKQFFQPVNMTVWTIVNTCNPRFCPEAAIQNFVSMLMQHGKQLGMNIAPPAKLTNCRPSDDPKRVLCEQKRQFKDIQIVFFVLAGSGKNSPLYCPLKNVAETDLGMVTQCVTDQSIVKKCNRATIVNILQKVNAKLGGINNAIPKEVKTIIFNRPVIVMGADVTHPAPTEMNKPSIAAVVASMDRFAFRYIATFRIQKQNTVAKARIEIIKDMKNIAKSLLLSFYQVNGVKPEKIIFYRDGVSEGQFSHVQQFELAALRDACRELELGYEPGITFLTVQKRHHTRFMPRNRSDGCGKCGNVPPGTVIDTEVTHPVDFDFFLCSHFGIQGTSRPAHYYVLWDDNNFKADTLQQLTYGLCHTYARCSRSVSIPTPVYYAHHATKRAKCYVDARTDGSDSGSSSGGSMLPTSVLDEAVKISTLMEKKMFFI